MISVIVYGRNDEHGYNLHKRAALSINSMAENLVATDDEIVFVDWNTNPSRPPFLIAIRDLLSEHARSLIKIIVVPPEVHQSATQGLTRLPVAEPIARNVGVRHSNPENQWLLSTNTDVLLGGKGPRLSDTVSTLPPGFFTAPRYEVPEWMWEGLSRCHSRSTQQQIDAWASGDLPLAVVRSYEGLTFDAGGDFQLFHRSAFEAIGGFDESMLKGWHVDSNFAKRMLQHCGQVGEFMGDPKVLHANHNRTHTQYTANRSESNDLEKYFFGRVETVSRSGQTGWGLPATSLRVFTLNDYDRLSGELLNLFQLHREDSFNTSSSDPTSRLMGIDFAVTLPFLFDAAMRGYSLGSITYMGTRPRFGSVLEEASAVVKCFNSEESTGNGVDRQTLVVVDCTPINSPRGAKQLSDLSETDRRSICDVLLSLKAMVHDARNRSAGQPIFAFVNFEANELTHIARIVVGESSAQYYGRLRFGPLRPGSSASVKLRARSARLILGAMKAMGISAALRRISLLDPEDELGHSEKEKRSSQVRGGLTLRTCFFRVSAYPSAIARRLAFSRFRIWLVSTASLDPKFQIPKSLHPVAEISKGERSNSPMTRETMAVVERRKGFRTNKTITTENDEAAR